jgi:hypothetical protein
MEPQIRSSRPLAGLGLVLSGALIAACNGAGAGPSGAASSAPVEPSMASSEAPAGTPAPTNQVEMSIDFLPTPSFDPSGVAVACDEATLGTAASMSCDDIVALTARVAATMSANPIKQVAVSKPADNPDAIQVTFWVQAEEGDELTAFTSTIDPANKTVTFPQEDAEAVFPTAS